MQTLSLIDSWPVRHASAARVGLDGTVHTHGDRTRSYRLASIAKVISTLAVLVAVEEGSIDLDSPVGQPGCTLRHLLSHAGGYGFDGAAPIVAPGRRRIYSNTGIELATEAVADATGIAFAEYLAEAVFLPLGMADTVLRGSPAHGIWSTVDDCISVLHQLMHPTLIAAETARDATSVQFADLDGVLPGVGSFRPCPWGLGAEIHGHKHPHWMGTTNSPTTFGHFGGAGTMLWVDPVAGIGVVALTDRPFDEWRDEALTLWPQFSDAALAEPLA